MKTKAWILIVALLLVVSLGLSLWVFLRPSGHVANVYRDGVCLLSVDLSTVTEAKTYTFSNEKGSNVILVEPGRICVQEADCPDQVCVKAGWLTSTPIVCLPHGLVIRLERTLRSPIDALAR